MYTSTPGARARATDDYAITAVAQRRFGAGTRTLDPATREYVEAIAPAAGVHMDDAAGVMGNAYADMATAVLDDLLAGGPLDLLVLAYAVPDFILADVAALDAAEAVGGVQACFGVTDQGSVTPFTALRLATMFAARHDYARAAVVVLDHATLPYVSEQEPTQELAGDAAVALLLERTPEQAGIRLAARSGLSGAGQEDRVAAFDRVTDAVLTKAQRSPSRVVAGPGIPPAWSARWSGQADVASTATGYPCTGVWTELASRGLDASGPTLVIETDPVIGAVHAALIDPVEPHTS